jgi:hypothetical protein
MKTLCPLACAIVATLALAGTPVLAAPAETGPASNTQFSTSLTPQQRGELTRQFVKKWGAYVQVAYGIDVHTWATRMRGTFATADPVNFQRALLRSTYEGAIATLDGAGHKLSDDRVITLLASSDPTVTPNALGDLDKDLVFTAMEPCRIVDTRNAGGAVAAGSYRLITIGGTTDFSVYGGSATDCGMTTQRPKAIVVNLTAVAPAQTGYATLYPSLIATPLAASMIYQSGVTLSNAVSTKVAGNDNVRLFSERTVHYVLDMVGYYDAPYATALDCVDVSGTSAAVAGKSNRTFVGGACAASYSLVGGECDTNNTTMRMVETTNSANSYSCEVYNDAAGTSATMVARSRCCRVPGR